MRKILDLIDRNVTFHCVARGDGEETCDFKVGHSFGELTQSSDIPAWAPPSLASIYEKWNGLTLFHSTFDANEGFRLFSIAEASLELARLQEIFSENQTLYEENSDFESLDSWLKGLLPIGEIMCSGDKFALDTLHKNENGECNVLFLDHEAYYGDCCSPEFMNIVADSAVGLLERILSDPLSFIASHWVGGDWQKQWYANSTSHT